MWTVIYIAPSSSIAEKYKQLLEDDGIFVQLRSVSEHKKSANSMTEILVSQSEAEEAHELLTNIMNKT